MDKMSKRAKAVSDLKSLFKLLNEDVLLGYTHLDEHKNIYFARALLRSKFALIEGVTYRMRVIALSSCGPGSDIFTDEEKSLLGESLPVDSKGSVRGNGKGRSSFEDLLCFTLQKYGKIHGVNGYSIQKSDSGWRKFKRALRYRNQITHPKCAEEFSLNSNDWEKVIEGLDWFDTQIKELLRELYPRKLVVVNEAGGISEPLIKESYNNGENASLWQKSSLALTVVLTELSIFNRVVRSEQGRYENESILGSGHFETVATNNNSNIASISLFGTDRVDVKGSIKISEASSEKEGIYFFVHEQSKAQSLCKSEEGWSLDVRVSRGEFNGLLADIKHNRLNEVNIRFSANGSALIFDSSPDDLYGDYHRVKLVPDDEILCLDSGECPSEWLVEDDFMTNFTMVVYTNKTVLDLC
jgi:hypothetical protein